MTHCLSHHWPGKCLGSRGAGWWWPVVVLAVAGVVVSAMVVAVVGVLVAKGGHGAGCS